MRDDDNHGIESQERRRSRLRRAGPLAAALAGVALLAAACSGGSASPGTGSGSGSPGGSGKTSELAYSQCMRAHGIKNFPDPNANGGINISGGQGTGLDPASPQFQAADKACKSLMPASSLSPAQQAQIKAGNLKYAQCMRAHGIADFPDPSSQGQIQIQAKPGSDLDPNNPRYQAANKACQQYQPGGGKGGSLSTNGNAPGGGA
jgi:hypothetical protein